MSYADLLRFLLPLVLTAFAQEFGGQVLNGGMARMPEATETLASFGLAWGLVSFLTSMLTQTRQLGLVLVDDQGSFRLVLRFVIGVGFVLASILAALALSPVGDWVIEELHGVGPQLSGVVREALFWLFPFPLLRGLIRFYSGTLLRIRRTDIVSVSLVLGVGVSILAVFGLLQVGLVRENPILLPVMVTYVGAIVEVGVLLWGYKLLVAPDLKVKSSALSLMYVASFFWPLALIMAVQGLSRPLINLFISRGPNAEQALAVLTVVYALGHLPYGWLNETRNLPSAFRDRANSLVLIRRFILYCGMISFGLMILMFWTPLRDTILVTWIGLTPELAAEAKTPLLIFSFFPLPVTLRGYLHGVGLLERRTRAMAPSGPTRIIAILIALVVLTLFGVEGATRGVAALFTGFVFEALMVWWGVRGRQRFRRVAWL